MELIKEIETSRNSSVLLKAIFEGDDAPTLLVKKQSQITEYLKENSDYSDKEDKEDKDEGDLV